MIADIVKDTETRMRKAMDALHHNLDSVRTGRASPTLVERIHGRLLRNRHARSTSWPASPYPSPG